MSTLQVDTIKTTAGAAPTLNDLSISHAGSVVQFVRDNPTSAYTTRYSATTTSFADTGFSIAITPKFSTSLILVQFSIQLGNPDGDYTYINMKRAISGGATTDLGSTHSDGRNFGIATQGPEDMWQQCAINYADAPATTSAVTYSLWARNNAGSSSHYIGWSSDNDLTHNQMFLTATEFKQ